MNNIGEIKEQIRLLIAENKYEDAESIFQKNSEEIEAYDDVWAVLDGSIGVYYEDRKRTWEAIRKGLLFNSKNYELYVMLGNYYLEENLQQAYLCYENALFYCTEEEDWNYIKSLLNQLEANGIFVNKVAFVILSYNLLDYTRLCINSIRGTVPEYAREIIVVDNASKDGSVEWLREQQDIVLIENEQNEGFPVGCNQGIVAASEEADILLLNNDTILAANSVFWLRMGLYADVKNGAAGSVSNYVGNGQKIETELTNVTDLLNLGERINVPMAYALELKLFLIGFALLIRREVLNEIGDMDERFSPGNSEDLDYGLRVVEAGYNNVLVKNSFIFHFGSVSFGKDQKAYRELLGRNKRKLNEKYGINTNYYLYPRWELVQLVQEPMEREMRVLDIGCGCGAMMAAIRGRYPNATAYGIEIVSRAAEFARHMGEVICGDVENVELPWEKEYFDYIMMGDVLEHLREPEVLLRKLHSLLKPDGYIIVSMPNVKHFSVMLPLLVNDEFSYTDAGILDTTHLKMFTGKEIANLIGRSGYKIEQWLGLYERQPNAEEEKIIDSLVALMKAPDRKTFLVYQYVAKARKIV